MNMQWVAAKFVLPLLTDKQKESHVNKCQDQQGKLQQLEYPLLSSEMTGLMLALKGRCDDIVMIREQLEAALTEFKI